MSPIETAPKDGRYILLFGPSGYTTTPLRCQVCRYDAKYRPLQPWVTYSNDSFFDSGDPPTGWLPLPTLQSKQRVATELRQQVRDAVAKIEGLDVFSLCREPVILRAEVVAVLKALKEATL